MHMNERRENVLLVKYFFSFSRKNDMQVLRTSPAVFAPGLPHMIEAGPGRTFVSHRSESTAAALCTRGPTG